MPASLTGKALALSIGSVLQKSSTFIVIILLVRLLDKEMYGTYQQVLYVAGIVYGLFASGLAASVYYFVPRLSDAQRGRFALQTVLIMATLGAAAAVAVFGFGAQIAQLIKNPALEPALGYYAAYIFFWIASDFFLPLLNASGRYVSSMLFAVTESITNAIFLVVPLFHGIDLPHAFLLLAGAAGLRYAIYLAVTVRLSGIRRVAGCLDTVGEQFRYSMPLTVSGWTDLIGGYLDKVVVSLVYSPAIVAIYAIGTIKIPLWEIVSKPINIVLRVKFAELISTGRAAEITPIWNEAVRKQSIVILPVVFLLGATADHLIPLLFTNAYAESISVFRISLLDKPLMIMSFSVLPLSMGRPDFLMKGSILFVIANIVFMTILAPTLGLYGLVSALVAAQYVHYAFYVYMIKRHLQIPPGALFPIPVLLRIVASNGVAAMAAYVLGLMLQSHVAAIAAGTVAYGLICYALLRAFGVLRPEDVRLVLRVISFGRFSGRPLAGRID